MAYTRDELEEKMLASYAEQGLEGELVELVSKILGDYLYIHQMEDLSILMEDSFLRSKLLNSRIQHAADNFYSVRRGQNRKIRITNLGSLTQRTVNKFDTVSTYGQYKLVYADNYVIDPANPFSFDGYLTIDNAQTITMQGNGRFYMDLEDADGNLVQNISENLIITSIDDRGTLGDTSDDQVHQFKVSSNLSELYTKEVDNNTAIVGGNGMMAEICAMTLPNYGVRLWKADRFQENYTYVIKYLKCPDETKPELDISKAIRSVPGFTKNANGITTITQLSAQELKEDDLDEIYLHASTKQKFQDTMKSINSIDEMVSAAYPELTGFNTIIGPMEELAIPSTEIRIYETGKTVTNGIPATELNKQLKAYYITQNAYLYNASKRAISLSGSTLAGPGNGKPPYLFVDIHYKDLIDIGKCEEIVNAPKAIVGKNFNPYQIIADLMSDDQLLGKFSLIDIYVKQSSGNDKYYLGTTTLNPDQCIDYTAQISYISERI